MKYFLFPKGSFLIGAFLCLVFLSLDVVAQLRSPLEPVGYIPGAQGSQEQLHNFFVSRRFRKAAYQRDSFYVLLASLHRQFEKDSTLRNLQIDSLNNDLLTLKQSYKDLVTTCDKTNTEYKAMSARFADFMKKSTSNDERMNIALAQKNEELEMQRRQLQESQKRLDELERVVGRQDSISKALRALIQRALLDFGSQDLTVELKNGKVYVSFSDEFLFKSGSADVESKGLGALKNLAGVISSNPKIDVLIEGHTDNVPIRVGKFRDNWDLSAARALSVVRLLSESYHVSPAQLTAAGRGEFVPKASNQTAEGKSKNRRIEIILIPDLSELYNIMYE